MKLKPIYFLVLLCTLVLFGCGNDEREEIPSDILGKQKMVDVIVGLNLSDAIISSSSGAGIKKNDKFKFNVFKECEVNSDQYYKSLKYYATEPELLQEIYQAAIDSVNRLKR